MRGRVEPFPVEGLFDRLCEAAVVRGLLFLAQVARDLGDDGGAQIVVARPEEGRGRFGGDELLLTGRGPGQHVVAVVAFVDDVVFGRGREIVDPETDWLVVFVQNAAVVEVLVEIPDEDGVVAAPGGVGIVPPDVVGADVGDATVFELGVLDVVEPFRPEAGHVFAGVER